LEALVKGTDDYDGSKIDKNGDGKISEKEASVVRGLRLSDFKIRCIDEISYFTALETLYCDHNQLTSLDLSKNAELYSLNCSGNNLKSVIVQRNYNYRLISSLDAITREYGDIISYVF